jgi:RNA polymerase II transcription initiation/nucleotide excision repair factor TFIIH, subunit TFB2
MFVVVTLVLLPELTVWQNPLLPVTVQDQIRLWELEKNRLKSHEGLTRAISRAVVTVTQAKPVNPLFQATSTPNLRLRQTTSWSLLTRKNSVWFFGTIRRSDASSQAWKGTRTSKASSRGGLGAGRNQSDMSGCFREADFQGGF